MKIGILINELDIRGGTHKQVLRLCQYLQRRGDTITIYTRKYEAYLTYPEFESIKVVVIPDEPEERSPLRLKFDRAFLVDYNAETILNSIDDDTDIVNIHDMGFQRVAYLIKTRRNIPVVWQINDLPTCFRLGFAEKVKDSWGLRIQRLMERRYAKRIDVISVNVSKNKERVVDCYGKEARVYYCGVDFNNGLKKHSYKKNIPIRLLSMGVFYPHRYYEALIEVVDYLKNKNIDVELNIIGSIDNDIVYYNKIKNLIDERGLDKEIHVRGQVDERQYCELFNNADVFLFLNVNQSWGLAVFEAMSCGLPVIVSDSVGATELLENGVDSVISDPNDTEAIANSIIMLADDEEYYNSLSQVAFEKAKTYTWDNMYSAKMRDLFEQLVNDPC